MGRSIEQMKTLIADANKKINEIDAQRDKAVEYKLNLLQQFTEVIGETTVVPDDSNYIYFCFKNFMTTIYIYLTSDFSQTSNKENNQR